MIATPRHAPSHLPRVLVVVAMALLLALVGQVPAHADSPSRLAGQITDTVGALDSGGQADIQTAIDDLYDAHRLRLWVVYVADFGTMDPLDWSLQTASLSDLGGNDVLLAVATVDRSYAMNLSNGAPSELTADEVAALQRDAVEPALREEDWAGAAIAAAGGLGDAMSSSGSGGFGAGAWITIAVIVLLVIGLVLFTRRRRAARHREAVEASKLVDATDPNALAALNIDILDDRAKAILVDTDNAISTSAEELQTARDELGDAATRPFTDAVEKAKVALGAAFAIRQRLDDAVPESPQQRRDMLVELIRSCAEADSRLDEQVEAFDAIRDLLIDAPARLDALTRKQVELSVRVPQSQRTLDALTTEFPVSTLAPVAQNVDLATGQIALAEENIDSGRTAAALPVGEQGAVVPAVRTAEAALSQARALLDAVDHAEADIRSAIASLPAAMADVKNDIASADQLASHGGPELAAARDAATEALARAEAGHTSDPLGSMNAIVAADSQLDTLLAAAAESKTQHEHAEQRLGNAISAATAQVNAARDFISTRRGAIGAEARTRLSEAERHLTAANQLSPTDPARALQHAQAATQLASAASTTAQSEVQQWDTRQRVGGGYHGRSMGSQAGGILAGVLISSVLRGGGGFGGGGFGGGGFGGGPGSFGGSGSSGRIGGGGRF